MSSHLKSQTTFILIFSVVFNLYLNAQVVIPPTGNTTQPDPNDPSQQMMPLDPSALPPGFSLPQQGMQGQPQIALSEMLGEANLAPNSTINRLPPVWPYYLGFGLLGFLLLLLLIWLIVRKNKKPKPVPFIPADIRALEKLDHIKPLIKEAKARDFSYQASEIMRSYIEERFGIQARNRTTREFLELASEANSTLPSKYEEPLNEFLKYCDLAKFAKQVMQPEQLNKMFQVASGFIKETRPSIMASKNQNSAPTKEDRHG